MFRTKIKYIYKKQNKIFNSIIHIRHIQHYVLAYMYVCIPYDFFIIYVHIHTCTYIHKYIRMYI